MPARVLTVLRSGGEYLPVHVERLRAQVARHAPGVEFVALTEGAGLRTDWPGWWAKIEAFRVPGPVLYMDLDTLIVGDIAPLLRVAEVHGFITLRDFHPKQRVVGSGLMAWSGDMTPLADVFAADPARHMAENASARWWGDQGFIERHGPPPAFWQDLLPGAVASWKLHCRQGVPDGTRVVCFHGKPRPWEVGL